MCWCRPEVKTPHCGSSRCIPPLTNGDISKFSSGFIAGGAAWAGCPPGETLKPVDTSRFIRPRSNYPIGWDERDGKI